MYLHLTISGNLENAISASNTQTACTRTQYFIDWGISKGLGEFYFDFTSPDDARKIIFAFVQETEENIIKHIHWPTIKTMQVYVLAASRFAINKDHDNPRFIPNSLKATGKRIYHPLLVSVFDTTKKWTPSKHHHFLRSSVFLLDRLYGLVAY